MTHLGIDSGLILLRVPSPRSTIPHQLIGTRLQSVTAPAYWIDARNTASTHTLYECATSQRVLNRLQIARAFTAYQHYALVREVAHTAPTETEIVIAPNVADLYHDDDLPSWEQEDLFAASLVTLRELSHALDCPIVVTASDPDTADRIATDADVDIECIPTREGIRFEGEHIQTTRYLHGTYWQTTIPYWVDICGSIDSVSIDPMITAYEQGLLEVAG